jgi:1-acyl-sn-glycerol-3-phosphate acyltransferase
MLVLRSLLFTLYLYGSMVVMGTVFAPVLMLSRPTVMRFAKGWARSVLWALRVICGVRVEMRGLQHRPAGAALIAAKHQGMLDVIAPFIYLDDPCFVLKKELIGLPFFGWYASRMRMIPVDRGAQTKALKQMVADMRDRLQEQRQIVIFPEGTRVALDAKGDYKPGVAALYRDLGDTPCTPVATNSGLYWPAHGFIRKPGVAVFEFLEPIPAGVKRGPFMQELETRIETASKALVAEGRRLAAPAVSVDQASTNA